LYFFVASVFGIFIRAFRVFRVIRGQILTEIPRSRFGSGWNGMENGEWRLKNEEWKMEEWRKPGLGPIGSKKITRALGKCGFVSGQLSLTTDVHRICGTIVKFVVVITTVPILLSGLRLHVGYS